MTPEEIGQLIADRVRKTREEGGGSDKFLFVSTLGPDERTICDLGNGPNGMANGQLIIAAPDMKLALEHVRDGHTDMDEILAAIAKAEGRTA